MSPMATKRCYYEVLEVSRTSTVVEIKKSYKKLAVANHPDRNPDDPDSAERFKEAAEAYEVLSDSSKRQVYDQHGHEGLRGRSGGGAGFTDMNDIFDHFGDIFGDMFGGGGGSRRRSSGTRGRRGNDVRTKVTVTLNDVADGCKKEIKLKRNEHCSSCEGSGAKPGTSPATCDYCDGQGAVVKSQGFFRMQTTCPACNGEGKIVRDKCDDCRGSGFERQDVNLDVAVPAGVEDGMQLCLRGEGEPGTPGAPRGDLYVDVQVKSHSMFERQGNHLVCRVPITYTQAVLGADIEIPLLDGKDTLTIPAGTQPNHMFRLRNKGLPELRSGRLGDLHVEAKIEVPKKLSEEQERVLRELAELEQTEVTPHRKTWFEELKSYFTGEE
ncbi:molecular chaperone DnaJ [Planctomycetaceae bacterium]|jgi:molecular chaperone DnaJ|nr:molecular chaperone DnaJ [Planctomycetaceae bacterium]MDC0273400.1 molecular chaperone DnaJ [Planctomycetaceae bacterium]